VNLFPETGIAEPPSGAATAAFTRSHKHARAHTANDFLGTADFVATAESYKILLLSEHSPIIVVLHNATALRNNSTYHAAAVEGNAENVRHTTFASISPRRDRSQFSPISRVCPLRACLRFVHYVIHHDDRARNAHTTVAVYYYTIHFYITGICSQNTTESR